MARATLVQLTDNGDGDDAVSRMPAFFREAKEHGSDIIVFPEYVLGSHIDGDHPRIRRFLQLVAEHGMYAIAGFIENHGTRWATTAILVDRQGRVLDRYLKIHPAAGDPPYHWPPIPGAASAAEAEGILGGQFKAFPLDFGVIGIIQCYDGLFPESWACTSYAGAEVIFWINGREGAVESHYCLTAAECQCCVVAANITNGKNTGFAGPWGLGVRALGREAETPFVYGQLYPAVATPGDAAVHAELDLVEIRKRRKHHRIFHQRRPELYHPIVNDVTVWKNYPHIPWVDPEAERQVNSAGLVRG